MKQSKTEIRCYRATCYGRMEFVNNDAADALYRCETCDKTLTKSSMQRLADNYENAIGQMAQTLLDGFSINE